jgi:hypothetical protein
VWLVYTTRLVGRESWSVLRLTKPLLLDDYSTGKVNMGCGRGGQIRLYHPTLHVLKERWWEGSFGGEGRGVLESFVSGGAGGDGKRRVAGGGREDQ